MTERWPPPVASASPENLSAMHLLKQKLQRPGPALQVLTSPPVVSDAQPSLKSTASDFIHVREFSIYHSPLPVGCIKTTQKEKIPLLCRPPLAINSEHLLTSSWSSGPSLLELSRLHKTQLVQNTNRRKNKGVAYVLRGNATILHSIKS